MTSIKRSAVLPYTARQVFDVVDAVEDYPKFLSWCPQSIVHHRTNDEVRATLILKKGALQYQFTTVNRLQSGKMIEVRLVEGPFKHLEGYWRFEDLGPKGTRIHFDIEFEFSNRLLRFAVSPTLQFMATTLVESFCKRAHVLYKPQHDIH